MSSISRWLFLGLLAVAAPGPEIRDFSITASGGQVLVTFRFDGGLTPEIRERIDSGLPTGLVYELEFMRDRKRWWDRALDESRIEIVAMYNAVTHEYLVNTKHDGDLIGSRTVREEEELERAMTELASFPAFDVSSDSSRDRYLVRIRVELGPGTALGMFPYQRTTPWRESNKVRLGVPEP
jgi:hypothetical protein